MFRKSSVVIYCLLIKQYFFFINEITELNFLWWNQVLGLLFEYDIYLLFRKFIFQGLLSMLVNSYIVASNHLYKIGKANFKLSKCLKCHITEQWTLIQQQSRILHPPPQTVLYRRTAPNEPILCVLPFWLPIFTWL